MGIYEPGAREEFALGLAAAIGGREWRVIGDAAGLPRSTLYDYVSGKRLPTEEALRRLIRVLDLRPAEIGVLHSLYASVVAEQGDSRSRHRRESARSKESTRKVGGVPPTMVVHNGGGGDVHIHPPPPPAPPKAASPPPLVEDVAGHSDKPDPLLAQSREEFLTTLRAFWLWAGGYSSRQLSAWCRVTPYGKVSHTTLNALLAEAPRNRPPVALRYVQTIITCCGASEADVQRWTTAWRRLYASIPVLLRTDQPQEQPPKRATGQVVRLPARSVDAN